MKPVPLIKAKKQLHHLIQQAIHGKEVVISVDGSPMVRLDPISKTKRYNRTPGLWEGKIEVAPDFDQLPKDIEDAFNG